MFALMFTRLGIFMLQIELAKTNDKEKIERGKNMWK